MNKILGILCSAFDLAGGVAGGLLVSNFSDGSLPFGLNSIEMESYSIFYPKRWGILVEIGRERSSLVSYLMLFSEGLSEVFIAESDDEN